MRRLEEMDSPARPARRVARLWGVAALAILFALFLVACGGQKQTGRVVAFGQSVPMGGGLVQSYIKVELDDGTQVRAWLPQDDALWTSMQSAARRGKTRVEIQKEKDYWVFVRVVPEGE